jgi:hypothetical protein
MSSIENVIIPSPKPRFRFRFKPDIGQEFNRLQITISPLVQAEKVPEVETLIKITDQKAVEAELDGFFQITKKEASCDLKTFINDVPKPITQQQFVKMGYEKTQGLIIRQEMKNRLLKGTSLEKPISLDGMRKEFDN